MGNVEWGVGSVECGVWSVECGVRSVERGGRNTRAARVGAKMAWHETQPMHRRPGGGGPGKMHMLTAADPQAGYFLYPGYAQQPKHQQDPTYLKQKVTRSPHGVLVTSAMQRSTLLPSAE